MTWWARWRKRTRPRCACVYFVSWETGTSWKLCIYLRERKAGVGRGSIKQFLMGLFTDTVAILNLLDLRSIMGSQRGTCSAFTRAFWAKRELHCIFLGKKAIIITSKHGTTIFFSHYNLFLGKLKEKLARKARVNTDASIWDRAHAPWASHNTP